MSRQSSHATTPKEKHSAKGGVKDPSSGELAVIWIVLSVKPWLQRLQNQRVDYDKQIGIGRAGKSSLQV